MDSAAARASADLAEAPRVQANFRHLYADVAWYGVLAGSVIAFLTVYATRIGASALDLGLITAGPALVQLLFSLPAGRWLQTQALDRATFWTAVLHRLPYLALVFLPGVLAAQAQVRVLLLLVLAMSLPGTALAIAFNAMFADAVPPADRGMVVGRRNALLAATLVTTSLACGGILARLPFPVNYQVVFALGAVGAAMSTYHLGRIRLTGEAQHPRLGRPLHDLARPGLFRFVEGIRAAVGLRFLTRSQPSPLLRLDLLRGPFGPLLFAYFAFYLFQFLPVPLFPLLWVRDLRLSDLVISLGHALYYGSMMVTSLSLRRASDRLGHHGLLRWGALAYALYPLLSSQASGAADYLLISGLGGAVWGFLNGGLTNRLLERVPEDDRPAHMALHNVVLNLGTLLGSLSGPLFADLLGLRQALLLAGLLRLLAGMLLARWG